MGPRAPRRAGAAGSGLPQLTNAEVFAGGGLVWDAAAERVLVVHRPGHDDWSFPKGKRDAGETDEACALREVEEETGLRCELGEELPSTRYVDRHGRQKVVRWWVMTAVGGELAPNDEVDDFRWLEPEDAAGLLTYERDRDLVAVFAAKVGRVFTRRSP